MAQFDRTKLDMFLGVVRKYMQIRGSLTQKDLADLTDTGVSTMSRFLNRKTADLNPRLIAKIVAKLNLPLHEMIEFVDEEYTDHFVRLVKFYKEEELLTAPSENNVSEEEVFDTEKTSSGEQQIQDIFNETFIDELSSGGGTAKSNVSAQIKVGNRKSTVSFQADNDSRNSEKNIKEKMNELSARQKGFLTDFLNLDSDGKDLIVDIGKNVITYLRQKGMGF